MIRRLFHYTLGSTILYRHLVNKILYPKLNVDPTVSIKKEGQLSYGTHCNINKGSTLIIPSSTSLSLGQECYIGRYVEIGPSNSISIGDYSSIQDRSIILGDVDIGRYCLLSLNVLMTTGKHQFEALPYRLIRDQDQMLLRSGVIQSNKITIEDDCWIGVNTVVMPGITIGKGAIIGANSVVTKDVPPYSVAVGSPARVIKQRLKFEPPPSIKYDNQLDMPYFYAGFELSDSEKAHTNHLEGYSIKSDFKLALKVQGFSKVVLEIKALDREQHLEFQDQSHKITEDFSNVSFELKKTEDSILKFSLQSREPTSRVIIKRAWVE